MALKLDILANTRQFVSEMKKAGASTEDISDALDELRRQGDKAGDQLEKSFKGMASEAKKTTKVIDKVTDDTKKSFGGIKDEARQSGAEAAASFSGEFSSVTDFTQEVAANLGPAGIAGGLIIGAVAAAATASVEAWNEKIDGVRQATADMWQQAADEGENFLSRDAIQAEAHRILWDDAYKNDMKNAQEAGVKREEFAIALAEGEGKIFESVKAKLIAAEKAKQEEVNRTQGVYRDNFDAEQVAQRAEAGALNTTIDLLTEKGKTVDTNKQKRKDAQAVDDALSQRERDQINRTADAAQARYEALAKKMKNPIKATVELSVTDKATAEADRIIRNINKRNATIGLTSRTLQ